jgi:hypothetical protein
VRAAEVVSRHAAPQMLMLGYCGRGLSDATAAATLGQSAGCVPNLRDLTLDGCYRLTDQGLAASARLTYLLPPSLPYPPATAPITRSSHTSALEREELVNSHERWKRPCLQTTPIPNRAMLDSAMAGWASFPTCSDAHPPSRAPLSVLSGAPALTALSVTSAPKITSAGLKAICQALACTLRSVTLDGFVPLRQAGCEQSHHLWGATSRSPPECTLFSNRTDRPPNVTDTGLTSK